MLRTLLLIKNTVFNVSGGYSQSAPLLIGINLTLVITVTGLVFYFGIVQEQINSADLLVESTSALVHFFLFVMCAAIRLNRQIKILLVTGLTLTQLGLLIDMFDEFILLSAVGWQLWGDILYLIGLLMVAYSASKWSIYAYQAATRDTLTGVYNRRYFDDVLKHYLSKMQRENLTASLVCLDLDNFKHLNDTYGHARGDDVLKLVGHTLNNQAREADIVSRSGGEEFEILMPGATVEKANKGAKRLLKKLKEITPASLPTITASIGVTELQHDDDVDTAKKRADDAMYDAKRSGKNRVVIY